VAPESFPPVEQIADILSGFYDLALTIRARRAEAERREHEQEQRRGAHAKLINQLETDAGA
jgi:DNA invertase Pin-like site-specific DNA recombinase